MKTMKIFMCLLVFLVLVGCAQMAKIEKQTYADGKKYAEGTMQAWSYWSGVYTCGMGASRITFPVTLKNGSDMEAIFNNPTVITGVAKLDNLAQTTVNPKTNQFYWVEHDWVLGCSNGVKGRMTVSEVIKIVKTLWPQAAEWLPMGF